MKWNLGFVGREIIDILTATMAEAALSTGTQRLLEHRLDQTRKQVPRAPIMVSRCKFNARR